MKIIVIAAVLALSPSVVFAQVPVPPPATFGVTLSASDIPDIRQVCDLALAPSAYTVETKSSIASYCGGLLSRLVAAQRAAVTPPPATPTIPSKK